MRCQLHLFELEVDRFVDSINEFVHTRIDRRQYGRLLIDLELKLGQQVLVESVLRGLDFVEQLHDLALSRIGSLVLLLGLLNNLIRHLAISAHELVSHLFELFFFGFELFLHVLVPLFAFHDEFCQEEPGVDVCLLQSAERIVRRLELDKLRDVRLVLKRARIMTILHQTVSS